jgi:hypothetical protein
MQKPHWGIDQGKRLYRPYAQTASRANLFDFGNPVSNTQGISKKEVLGMEITAEERTMLRKIVDNQFTGGAYKRATFIDKVCRTKADRALLDTLQRKGLVETGLGGTVAGDVYDGVWLTEKGKEADREAG